MKDKKQPPLEQWDDWSEPTYRTGGTQPPKSHGGAIAFLLVLVIFLSGVSTALGLMNIRLFRQLSAQQETEPAPVVFSQSSAAEDRQSPSILGIEGMAVPDFWQNYHDLPRGIYVTDVHPGSDARSKGVLPGDILTAFNGAEVTELQTLQQLLEAYEPGSAVTLCLYRNGEYIEISVILQ